jgi:hypothetical protein
MLSFNCENKNVRKIGFLSAFHNRWNSNVGVRHPNIWIFLRQMKDEEKRCRITLRAAERGDPTPKGKRCYRQVQKRIRHLKKDYRSGRRNLKQYWAAISYAVHNFQ